MMIWINIKMALSALRSAKVRTFLTMVAVIIGVTAFTVITTFAEGFKLSIKNEINAFGGNLVQVSPGQTVTRDDEGNITSFNPAAAFGTSTLSERDLLSIQKTPGVKGASPFMMVSGLVKRGDETLAGGTIVATNQHYPSTFNQTVEKGAFFSDASRAKNVVIGSEVATQLFRDVDPVGQTLTIRDQKFAIIGVMKEVKTSFEFAGNYNTFVFVSFKVGKQFNNNVAQIMEIDAQLNDDANVDQTVAKINRSLKLNHGGEEDFTVIKQEEALKLTDNIIGMAAKIASTFAYVMLLVGSLVIMLIMLVSVSERTREIGLRKSIGAANSHIMVQFLIEAVVISWFGSVIGIALSFGLGNLIKNAIDITPQYSLNTLIATVIIATIVGALAGIAPAFKAARKNPVEALRHE